jgi:hypothetical protein
LLKMMFYPFTCKQHNLIILYSWRILHCVYTSHLLNLLISCGHLCCFQSLAIVNKHEYTSVSIITLAHISLEIYQVVVSLDHMGDLFFFQGIAILFSKPVALIYISTIGR